MYTWTRASTLLEAVGSTCAAPAFTASAALGPLPEEEATDAGAEPGVAHGLDNSGGIVLPAAAGRRCSMDGSATAGVRDPEGELCVLTGRELAAPLAAMAGSGRSTTTVATADGGGGVWPLLLAAATGLLPWKR